MSTRHSDNDGSDIFWPGYVDAVTNLVLNLLFLLTIMTVAVFMFALELGRASKGGPDKAMVASTKQNTEAASIKPIDPVKENIALKREIERLNMMIAQQSSKNARSAVPPGDQLKTVDVTSHLEQPKIGLDKTLASDFEVIVRFTDEAVAFTPEERDQLVESLKPVIASGKASIVVEVPAGFSEAKRMGYYRLMAVRNLLLEMQLPKENIDVAVFEGKSTANAAIVRVR